MFERKTVSGRSAPAALCLLLCLTAFALSALSGCDMTYITPPEPVSAGPENQDAEDRAALEKDGRYLKIIHLPYNTQTTSFSLVQTANAAAPLAHCPAFNTIKLYRDTEGVTAYAPLSYIDSAGDFIESGPFYVRLSAVIDAFTWLKVSPESKVVVEFSEGRGVLDVLSLTPGDTISPDWPITSNEQQELLEQTGRYLKLINMPLNTLPANVTSAFIADSRSSIAQKTGAAVFKLSSTSTVYVSLANSDGSEFLASGPFFVVLSVSIDASTWIDIPLSAQVAVQFTNGQGVLDILSLRPGDTVSPEWPVTEPEPGGGPGGGQASPDLIAEIERNGSYILLFHLPGGSLPEFISGLSVSDGYASVASADRSSGAAWVQDGSFVNIYVPLVNANGRPFNRTGAFWAAFSLRVDTLTSVTVSLSDYADVQFNAGVGVLDVPRLFRNNPDLFPLPDDPAVDNQIDSIIASGSYIRFVNLPYNTSKYSFAALSVDGDVSPVAKPSDYDAIAVRKLPGVAEAFVPVVLVRGGGPFSESGLFAVSFTINISVGCRIIVLPSYVPRPLYLFDNGSAVIDASSVPQPPPQPPVVTHCLTISGLPVNTSPALFSNIAVFNSAGPVAKCPDYSRITTAPLRDGSSSYAVIPLVYDNNPSYNDRDFAESGSFLITFNAFPDAESVISVSLDNNCRASFSNGSASVSVALIPQVPRRTLSISGLPPNTQAGNIASLFIFNQSGKIAQCSDYSLVEAVTGPSLSVTLRVPLAYASGLYKDSMFIESGPFYVAFDINPDALTRFILQENDHYAVSFSDGNGSLDISTINPALPTPYFTILGLPVNTAKGNFSNVFLYNGAGKVAKCADYNNIIISKNDTSAAAMIPLVYENNSSQFFRDSGLFVVTFSVYIDINVNIIKERSDSLPVYFIDGSGTYNLGADLGYSTVSLTNPSDTSPPILKAGSVFEMNGSYEKLTANTPVQAASFSSTAVIYVYAEKIVGNLSFFYSTTAPSFNPLKNGFYSGDRRALFKLLFIRDNQNLYAAKTPVANNWPSFARFSVSNPSYSSQGRSVSYGFSGASNPPPQYYTASSGWYLITLAGAGGGSAQEANPSGAPGGYVAEIVYLPAVPITVFSGSGGQNGSAIGGDAGGGGAGGGSGSFVFSDYGYLLCAGGGGGAGGDTDDGAGGVGGAGGSIGSGGGGGGGGGDSNRDGSNKRSGAQGSPGGGYGGGAGGVPGNWNHSGDPGGNGWYLGIANALGYSYPINTDTGDHGYNGGGGGLAGYASYAAPNDWLNTNNANGHGGLDSYTGYEPSAGGNNRNGNRGGGGAPGSVAAGFPGVPGGAGYAYLYHLGN